LIQKEEVKIITDEKKVDVVSAKVVSEASEPEKKREEVTPSAGLI
jgi:hypothetical protein